MSDFKPCPVCQEQSDQCLSCASYVVDGERIYYEKLKDFGATKDHEIRFINRIQKQRTTAFFHNGKLYIPSRQGKSVPLAIGLQWDAWQEQQAKIDELQKLRGLDEMAISQIAHANQQWQLKCDELQKRVDAAQQLIEDLNECYQQDHQNKFEYWRGFADSAGTFGKRLKQAIKGGDE